jgi:hypothetical protein
MSSSGPKTGEYAFLIKGFWSLSVNFLTLRLILAFRELSREGRRGFIVKSSMSVHTG